MTQPIHQSTDEDSCLVVHQIKPQSHQAQPTVLQRNHYQKHTNKAHNHK